MFSGIAVHSSSVRRQYTHALAVNSGMLLLNKTTDQYPSESELTRLCSLSPPDVILLDIENPELALRTLQTLQNAYPDTPVICFGGTQPQHKTFTLYGVNHFLSYPPEMHVFISALAQAIRTQHAEPMENLVAFMPAKAGCGSTSLAMAASATLASALQKSVLCLEADLRSGPMALMFGIHPRGSTQGALSSAYELDNFRWDNCVTPRHGVDFLLSSGGIPQPLPEWSHYFALLRFVQNRYDAIVADLPELVNDATEEIIRRARLTIVVATQEPVSLKLAERRIADLEKWGAREERIRLVVNRWNSRDTDAREVASLAACPIHWKIPNDYQKARQVQSGQLPVPASSALGKSLLQLANDIFALPGAAPQLSLAATLRALVSRSEPAR